MNLIKDVWIPVQRFSEKLEEISPFEITSRIENDSDPIMSLNAPRPDFNGALLQFLVGLLQAVFPPENETEWEDLFVNPPSPEVLKEAMEKVKSAFELFGDGPRFMQDTNLNEEDTVFDISALFIESPGENTIKLKKDFFIKRNSISQICEKCAGIGLFSFQTNSPSGGQGHLTSIRGGGPLTTFVTSKLKTLKKLSLVETLAQCSSEILLPSQRPKKDSVSIRLSLDQPENRRSSIERENDHSQRPTSFERLLVLSEKNPPT
ncbi:CRISPR-associated protein CasA/Cse1, type TIGR02547-like protein [Leptospira borgpetersenii str. 200701203]|uniref:CRISPR-associated protein CasA/Cse1, type TIGR02547-like protein n=1 Tax=Leptospira borgpetersenii str. 200701203 TaxID=1193007 RepID=M3H3A9_LEPBO|nr:CRISPR-associated protein CasA/Cse1, type TIGR02547-like protein [Leptospira borgpetersenii str. 200701203]